MASRKAGIGQAMERAALELYAERGTFHMTAAEIAARAGTTERTFFRHFPDKLDVFFGDERRLRQLVAQAIVAAPAHLSPLAAAMAGLAAQAADFDDNRAVIRQRAAVVATHPQLQAGEIARTASWTAQIKEALTRRGAPSAQRDVAAWTALIAFRIAYDEWVADTRIRSFRRHLDTVLRQIHEQTGRTLSEQVAQLRR